MSNESIADSRLRELDIKKIFEEDKYIIPIYQRNYAWKETQIVQLLQDVWDHYKNNEEVKGKSYYLGTLVVFKRKDENFEVIDGQQRLTTLFIILKVLYRNLKNEDLEKITINELKFESREKSSETLNVLGKDDFMNRENLNADIISAYKIVKKFMGTKLREKNNNIQIFKEHLLNYVKILRVEVPRDTDLNHYFEIMNNRGEQLEKHEILKSNLLEKLDEGDRESFNLIWEACSDMNRYIQYGFETDSRTSIFGVDLNQFNVLKFDEIKEKIILSKSSESLEAIFSLEKLIQKECVEKAEETEEKNKKDQDRFSSIIDFPNFLLHVLKIQFVSENSISLDDKKLIENFNLISQEKDKIKKFGYNLLKVRFLFDKYIIKREIIGNNDGWSLKTIKRYETNNISYVNTFDNDDNTIKEENANNKKLIMLLSMFHVSYPTRIYKNWLNAVLYFLSEENEIKGKEYSEYLERLGNLFFWNRYMGEKEYEDILYKDTEDINLENINDSVLDCGTGVPNFIFNYLDYLLWKKSKKEKEYNKFEFTFRSSVEHYYPQHPISGDKLDDETLNSFGNLCLISANKNSKLSNYLPQAKKEHYVENKKIESIKQIIMMKKDNWWKDEIKKHREEMIEILMGKK